MWIHVPHVLLKDKQWIFCDIDKFLWAHKHDNLNIRSQAPKVWIHLSTKTLSWSRVTGNHTNISKADEKRVLNTNQWETVIIMLSELWMHLWNFQGGEGFILLHSQCISAQILLFFLPIQPLIYHLVVASCNAAVISSSQFVYNP